MAVLTYVTINGVNVTSKVLRWTFIDTYGSEIPDLSLELSSSILTTIIPENGQEVIVTRGPVTGQEFNIFKGNVDTVNKNVPYIEIKCKDKLIALVKTDVNISFDKDIDSEAGVASEIANTLITTYGGLSTNSGATVVSTGAVVLLDKFLCRKTDIFERVKWIANTFDYQIYYNYDDDYVYFEPQGNSTNVNALIVGTNVCNIPKWEFDNTQLVNQIRVDGAEQMVETTESGQIGVTSGYTQTSIILTKSPFSTKVYCDAATPATTLRIGGTIDGTAIADYDYSVDVENRQIIWNTTTYTPGASDYVEVRYTYPSPVPVLRKRATSISAYGLSSVTKSFSDIKTIEDATNRGNIFLDTYAEPFVRVQLNVPDISNDYRAGQMVTIVDNANGENRELVINKLIRSYPHKFDQIHCGNQEYALAEYNKLTLDRIKRLEEAQNKNDDILIQIIDLDRTIKPRRRYIKLQKQSIAGDTLIWNHPTYGIWNEYKWGSTAQSSFVLGSPSYGILGTSELGSQASAAVTMKLVQGKMTYQEYAYDTDFHDAVNSTATFSTVTQDIAFTAGQVWYSGAIDIGTTLSFVTITLGTTVGTLKIEISSDNKATWQTVTNGTRTAVTSSDGTGTYIRITENATAVASIDNTYDTYGQYTAPCVKVYMEE